MLFATRTWLTLALLTVLSPSLAAQGADYDIWEDPKFTEPGEQMLSAVLEEAGGLEAWSKIESLRFDLLKVRRVLLNTETMERAVHHVIPRLCWMTRDGDGFTISEYTNPKNYEADYRRDISVGDFAWAESRGLANRKPKQAQTSRTLIRRTAFLSMMPFSLHERGAKWIYLKDLKGDNALYGMRLTDPLVMETENEMVDFLVIVDKKHKVVRQLQYSLTGEDRITMDASSECYVNFGEPYEVEGVKLFGFHRWFYELPHAEEEFTIRDVEALPVPAAAMRRPWQAGGEVWETDLRADHWDPPAEVEEADEGSETPPEDEGEEEGESMEGALRAPKGPQPTPAGAAHRD